MPRQKYDHRRALDISIHPHTVTLDKGFYQEYYEKNQKPYVRMAPYISSAKKDHTDSKVFGIVCIHDRCTHGDVHRHPDSEMKLVSFNPLKGVVNE